MKKQRSTFAPAKLAGVIRKITTRATPTYAQLATVNEKGRPEVRTIDLFYVKELKTIAFNTNARTLKVKQLKAKRRIAGCHFDPVLQVQIRWTGTIEFLKKARNAKEKKLLDRLWLKIAPTIRQGYWLVHGGEGKISERCPDSLTVVCLPDRWDVYQHHPTDYLKSRRWIAVLRNRQWQLWRISPLAEISQQPFL